MLVLEDRLDWLAYVLIQKCFCFSLVGEPNKSDSGVGFGQKNVKHDLQNFLDVLIVPAALYQKSEQATDQPNAAWLHNFLCINFFRCQSLEWCLVLLKEALGEYDVWLAQL